MPRHAGWFTSCGQHLGSGLFVLLVFAHVTPSGEVSPWRRAMCYLWQTLPGLISSPDFLQKRSSLNGREGSRMVLSDVYTARTLRFTTEMSHLFGVTGSSWSFQSSGISCYWSFNSDDKPGEGMSVAPLPYLVGWVYGSSVCPEYHKPLLNRFTRLLSYSPLFMEGIKLVFKGLDSLTWLFLHFLSLLTKHILSSFKCKTSPVILNMCEY